VRRSRATIRESPPEVDEEHGARRHPEPTPARRLVVATSALMLATAGIAFAIDALRPDPTPAADETPSGQPSPIPSLTGEPRITADIPLADPEVDHPIGGVAVGAESAWVGLHRRGESGAVARIDLQTNEVLTEIPVRKTPYRKQIVAIDDAVWVASTGVLQRIDPATNSVVASVDLQGRSVSAIAADATAVWALATTEPSEEGGEWTENLVRVDPATNAVVAEIALGLQVSGYEDEVVLGAGSVWVLGVRWFEQEDAEYGSDLIRIDPTTNRVAARVPVGGFHMVMGTGEVWVRSPADGVFDQSVERWLWTRVDFWTNEASEPFEFEDQGLRLVSPDALWSVGYDERENVRVTRFDPESLEVEARSEPIRSLFHDAVLDPASGTVWISAVWSLVRVDIGDRAPPDPSPGPPPLTEGAAQHDPKGGVFILTPPDWSYLADPSGPSEPKMLFAIASYPIDRGGECAPTRALEALPPDGALAWVLEYQAARGDDFSPRPDRFSLDPSTLATYECSGTHPTYLFRFRDQDRNFQVQVAFGESAADEVRDLMLASLSSLVVDRCPPAEPPVLVSEFGTVVPDRGARGDDITLSGPTGRDENWFWSPLETIEVWWGPDSAIVREEAADKHLLASIDPAEQCSFDLTFQVPNAHAGRYVITVLGHHADGFGLMGERTFTVNE
jgi:hypothetical protein